MNRKSLKILEKLQIKFLRVTLAVGAGCPTPVLYSETGIVRVSNRIIQRKFSFLHHIAMLPPGSLAREMFELQTAQNLPGLATECAPLLSELGLSSGGAGTE